MLLWILCIAIGAAYASKCSDSNFSCPDSSTCCKTEDGDWGCCPHKDAVCCSDKLHCCPSGSKCDIEHEQCISEFGFAIMARKQKAVRIFPAESLEYHNDVIEEKKPLESSALESNLGNSECNNGGQCKSGETCCSVVASVFICCPFPKFVCQKMGCKSVTKRKSIQTTESVDSKLKEIENDITKDSTAAYILQPSNVEVNVGAVACPNGNYCPAGNTCCPIGAGQYGCCPFSKGGCCNAKECCAKGFVCNGDNCIREMISQSLLHKYFIYSQKAVPLIMTVSQEKEEDYGF